MTSAVIKGALLVLTMWCCFSVGKNEGGYRECRRQFATVDTAPAVWEHCNRVYHRRAGGEP